MNNYERGECDALERGMKAIRVLVDKLAAARADSAEWKEQHENLLAMFRAAEQDAVRSNEIHAPINHVAAIELLRELRPLVAADAGAAHMMDGFGPIVDGIPTGNRVRRREDDLLERLDALLSPQPRTAHSMSEYRRVTAQGGEIQKPKAAPKDSSGN